MQTKRLVAWEEEFYVWLCCNLSEILWVIVIITLNSFTSLPRHFPSFTEPPIPLLNPSVSFALLMEEQLNGTRKEVG